MDVEWSGVVWSGSSAEEDRVHHSLLPLLVIVTGRLPLRRVLLVLGLLSGVHPLTDRLVLLSGMRSHRVQLLLQRLLTELHLLGHRPMGLGLLGIVRGELQRRDVHIAPP